MNLRSAALPIVILCAYSAACADAEQVDPGGSDEAPIVDGEVEPGFAAAGLVDTNIGGFCSGVLIAPDVVLTAAHCAMTDFGAAVPDAFYIGAGRAVKTSNVPKALTRYEVKAAVAFGDFDDIGSNEICPHSTPDVALFLLSTPVEGVTPAEIADVPELGTTCTVVGYGRHTDAAGKTTRFRRRSAELTLTEVFPQALLLKRGTGVSDAGDSGGPLFCDGKVVGLVSCGPNDEAAAATDDYYARVWTLKSKIQSRITRWHNQ